MASSRSRVSSVHSTPEATAYHVSYSIRLLPSHDPRESLSSSTTQKAATGGGGPRCQHATHRRFTEVALVYQYRVNSVAKFEATAVVTRSHPWIHCLARTCILSTKRTESLSVPDSLTQLIITFHPLTA